MKGVNVKSMSLPDNQHFKDLHDLSTQMKNIFFHLMFPNFKKSNSGLQKCKKVFVLSICKEW